MDTRILIVEDDPQWREILSRILYRIGSHVTLDWSSTINDSREKLASRTWNLVVTDLVISNEGDLVLDSLQMLMHSLEQQAQKVPVVVITGVPISDAQLRHILNLYPQYLQGWHAKGGFDTDDFLGNVTRVLTSNLKDSRSENMPVVAFNHILRYIFQIFAPLLKTQSPRDLLDTNKTPPLKSELRDEMLDDIHKILAIYAHELRGPLTIAENKVSNLLHGVRGPLSPGQLSLVHEVQSLLLRSGKLLDAHLQLHRAEHGGLISNYPEYNLLDLLEYEVNQYQPQAERQSVQIQIELTDTQAMVTIDENHLIVGLSPLMSNAIEYAPENTTIYVRGKLQSEFVEVEIANEGPRIPEEIMRRIRDPDLAWSKSPNIGLAFAKYIFERHGGEMLIADNEPSGTIVRLLLPIKRQR